MTTASVASLRSAPTMAVYGLACVFLYIVPAIVFLMPQALVAAELASGWSGGVFRWVSEGVSPRWGLLAVWCQFAMTIFSYPTTRREPTKWLEPLTSSLPSLRLGEAESLEIAPFSAPLLGSSRVQSSDKDGQSRTKAT
jgi:hypothetical protein